MLVSYDGEQFEGTRKEAIMWLRDRQLKQEAIAQLVGCTKSYVSFVLRQVGKAGRISFAEILSNPDIFERYTDEEIANKYGLKLYRVRSARKAGGFGREVINVERRRRYLARYLFNDVPGPRFDLFINSVLYSGQLTNRQAQLIQDFYLRGCPEIKWGYVYRSRFAKVRLKNLIHRNYDLAKLKEQGVYGHSDSQSEQDRGCPAVRREEDGAIAC